jgi:predicted MPP superfamily phosphohydrolase
MPALIIELGRPDLRRYRRSSPPVVSTVAGYRGSEEVCVPVPVLVLFFAAAVGITLALHLYLWHRLVRNTTRPGSRRRLIGTVAIAVLGLGLVASLVINGGFVVFAWTGYIWLALMFYLVVALLVMEVPRLAVGWWLRRGGRATPADATPEAVPPAAEADAGRRLFLARSVAIVAGLTAVGTTGYGMTVALGAPVIERVPIALRRLGRPLDGYRIALISDVHLGPILGRAHTERLVRTINGLHADLVAITGDLADGSVDELGRAGEPLRDLRSTHGTYFVTGNHEYYTGDLANWLDALRGWGVNLLLNSRVEITRGSAALDLAGVNDPTGGWYDGGPDFARAVGDRDPSRPVVLLSHQPVQVKQARRHGVDLQLSGHTHGGQMCPFNLLVPLQQPVVAGRSRFGDTELYVTRGAGFWGPPVRVGAEPEVTLIELRAW